MIRHLLSDNDLRAWGTIPRLVYRALDGDVEEVAAILATDSGMCIGYLPRCAELVSLGTYLSFTCGAVPPVSDADAPFGTAFGASDPYAAACRAWGIQPPAPRSAPVESDAPALVLRGEYDAFSPLTLVQSVTGGMPNAHVVLVPYLGHDVLGTYDCMRTTRNTWLLRPENEPLYEECLRTIPEPVFEQP